MNFHWTIFIDLGIIALALIAATALRSKVKFFQKFLVPNALIAGFFLLPLYNFVFPYLGITTVNLGNLAYHLLSISFLALILKKPPVQKSTHDGRIFSTSIIILSQMAVQVLIGLLLTLIFINTIYPDLFHSFGLLLPLGFSQGPGQAFAIGEGWSAMGIEGAGSIGLTFAAIGFIVCSFGGIYLINFGIRRGWISKKHLEFMQSKDLRTGIHPRGTVLPVGAKLTTETEAIDSMSFNISFVLFGYFLTFLLLKGISFLLSFAGPPGQELAVTLWGISFIFAALVGLIMKKVMSAAGKDHLVDNLTMNRVAGTSVDFMVASAIAAISLIIVSQYIVPILIISIAGVVTAIILVPWISSRLFRDHRFLRMILLFGVSTGTLSTGLALLRVLDPEFETPVASDYSPAAAIVLPLVIPLILSLNLPAKTYQTGDMTWFWLLVFIALGYILFVTISFLFLAKKRAFKHFTKIWYPED
jgi:ESS family glutamate:Na+ symporter